MYQLTHLLPVQVSHQLISPQELLRVPQTQSKLNKSSLYTIVSRLKTTTAECMDQKDL